MFFLKCKISGFMLQSFEVKNGGDCGTKINSTFTLNAQDALSFEASTKANRFCEFINKFSPAPLPYEFDGGTHVKLEVMKFETFNFESEVLED